MKQYIKPKFEVINIDNREIIATSLEYYNGPDDWADYEGDAL